MTDEIEVAPMRWPTIGAQTRPWTRWWWHGSAVDERNLTRLLEEYARVGLGGVEVTPIYGVRGQESRQIDYLSPKWVAMLRHTCAEAQRLGLLVDMPPGSGWKMGGPHLRGDERNAAVAVESHAVGEGDTPELEEAPAAYQALRAFGPQGEVVDLSSRLTAGGGIAWSAPAPGWRVYALRQRWSKDAIKRAGRGWRGPAFNPAYRPALAAVERPFDELFKQLPRGSLRAQFHDSFEYRGDWCPDFLTQFQRRRGYDLADHLPAFAGEGPLDVAARVKADYRLTYGELLLEEFILPWVAWCHEHGQLARNQAHGSPGNLLDLYGAADIPETEVYRTPTEWTPIMTQFASSAAHVMGRPLCSSESCTWLGEHFQVTLSAAKATLDVQMLAGVNHNIYHGTAYSPDDAPWPGWLFYASTQFNPQNPIWRHFPQLNHYVARCQSVLQSGQPDNDILLYWPYADVLHDPHGRQHKLTVHDIDWFTDHPFGRLARELRDHGYAADFISDAQLQTLAVEDGRLRAAGGSYRVLIVPACLHMPVATLQRVLELVSNSATVLFQEPLPEDVPGLFHLEERRQRLTQLVDRVRADRSSRILRGADVRALLQQAGVRREPLVDCGLSFIRRRHPDGWWHFIVNVSSAPVDDWVALAQPVSSAAVMDPMTGEVGLADVRSAAGEVRVRLQLAPGQSCVLQSWEREVRGPRWRYLEPSGEPTELTGRWQVAFVGGGPERPPAFQTERLESWARLAGGAAEAFAGAASYRLTFDAPDPGVDDWLLDLGDVADSARVRLNGGDLGTLIAPPFAVRTGKLRSTGNDLEVEVVNVAANRIRDMDRLGREWRIFEDINFISRHGKRFDASDWPVRDAGLLGPVRLTPLRGDDR